MRATALAYRRDHKCFAASETPTARIIDLMKIGMQPLLHGLFQALSRPHHLSNGSASSRLAEDRFDGAYNDGRIGLWIQKQFFDLVVATGKWVSNDYATEQLQSELRQARSPVRVCHRNGLKNRAILPLESPSPGGSYYHSIYWLSVNVRA